MQSIEKAKELLNKGIKVKDVCKMVRLSSAICQQLKREMKTDILDFGCVVCACKKKVNKLFCNIHYQKYIAYPKIKKY